MPADHLARARALFVEHDGSTYGMWRNGVVDEYRSYAVPEAIERTWLDELAAERLAHLGEPGSAGTPGFLCDHGYLDHLPELLATRPTGALDERLFYEQQLLRYLDALTVDAEDRSAALESIIDVTGNLQRRARSDRTRARIAEVTAGAKRRAAAPDRRA